MEDHIENVVFSIIIPAYNAEELYLKECINSLINQTFLAFEIIIIDDGSCKESADLYDEISLIDHRIKVFHQVNKGVSAARNSGIDNASGAWIMFVDSDDWIEKNTCERLYDFLSKTQCDILLFGHVKEYSNGLKRIPKAGLRNNTLYCMDDISTKELFYRRAMGTPNIDNDNLSNLYYSTDKVYSRFFLLNNGLRFPEGLPKSEDKVFILHCFEKMHLLLYEDLSLYHYRINEQSVSNKYSPNVEEERRMLAGYLDEISKRMDAELRLLTNNYSYNVIYQEYIRFIFGIISDILFSKYYHKDYPYSTIQRKKEVNEFLKSEPFRSAIELCKYCDLGAGAKLKKFMLSHGMTTLFCEGKKTLYRLKRQISQQTVT